MGGSIPLVIWTVASALSNALLLVALVLIWWRPLAVKRALVRMLAIATLVNATWFFMPDMRPDLRVGYYFWLAAFVLAAFAARATVGEVAARWA